MNKKDQTIHLFDFETTPSEIINKIETLIHLD